MTTPNVQLLAPKRLCHMTIRTTPERFQLFIEFYKNILGGHIVWKNELLCFITYDDEHHRIAITGRPGTAPRVANPQQASGLAHIAFAYDSVAELAQAYQERKTLGMFPTWAVNHGPTTSLYYSDPDGNEVELQVDNFNTSEETTAFMNGPEFLENPMGVDFDPEDLVKRVNAGEDEASIKKRPNIGPRLTRY